MEVARLFSIVGRLKGVQGYILLDGKGEIMAHDAKSPEALSPMVHTCCRTLLAMGKKHFKYAVFSRKSRNNILIFPVGKYCLGVIKKKNTRNRDTAEGVLEFLNTLTGKRG